MADQIPIDQCWDKFCSLQNKDDPSAMVYGLNCYSSDERYNLKKTSSGSALSRDDVLTISYNKQDQTVKFACKNLDFY